jgi:hypothetical protein
MVAPWVKLFTARYKVSRQILSGSNGMLSEDDSWLKDYAILYRSGLIDWREVEDVCSICGYKEGVERKTLEHFQVEHKGEFIMAVLAGE